MAQMECSDQPIKKSAFCLFQTLLVSLTPEGRKTKLVIVWNKEKLKLA